MPTCDGVEATEQILAIHPRDPSDPALGRAGPSVVTALRRGRTAISRRTRPTRTRRRHPERGGRSARHRLVGAGARARCPASHARPQPVVVARTSDPGVCRSGKHQRADSSRELGRSISTVKAQLAALYEKLGSERPSFRAGRVLPTWMDRVGASDGQGNAATKAAERNVHQRSALKARDRSGSPRARVGRGRSRDPELDQTRSIAAAALPDPCIDRGRRRDDPPDARRGDRADDRTSRSSEWRRTPAKLSGSRRSATPMWHSSTSGCRTAAAHALPVRSDGDLPTRASSRSRHIATIAASRTCWPAARRATWSRTPRSRRDRGRDRLLGRRRRFALSRRDGARGVGAGQPAG